MLQLIVLLFRPIAHFAESLIYPSQQILSLLLPLLQTVLQIHAQPVGYFLLVFEDEFCLLFVGFDAPLDVQIELTDAPIHIFEVAHHLVVVELAVG